MSNQTRIKCSDCDNEIIDPETESKANPQPCASCGSFARTVMLSVSDEIPLQLKERLRATVRNANYKSKDKRRRDLISGDELHQKTGKWIIKQRDINKDQNSYLEKIIDPETGEIIHNCEEPLDKHRGHGSAKKRPDES